MNNNPHRQTSWDAFTDDAAKGIIIIIAIVVAIAFPPILFVYAGFGLLYAFSKNAEKKERPFKAFARVQPNGLYTVFNPDGTVRAENVHERHLGKLL